MVAYGSPKPLIWVRILVPVQRNFCIEKNEKMIKIFNYFRDSYKELMEKVTWPTWPQLQQSTMIVIAATIVITLIVLAMDTVAGNGMKFIYRQLY